MMVNSLLIDGYASEQKADEIWKDIPGYEGLYEASNLGRIRTKFGKTTSSRRFPQRVWKQRILKQKNVPNKYGRVDARVCLWRDGKEKTHLVSRLVCSTFVLGYFEGATVNHKDGNPRNNATSNLEWLSLKDNIRHGFKSGLYKTHAVRLEDENHLYVDFISLSEASRYLGRNTGYVSRALLKNKEYCTSQDGEVFKVTNLQ